MLINTGWFSNWNRHQKPIISRLIWHENNYKKIFLISREDENLHVAKPKKDNTKELEMLRRKVDSMTNLLNEKKSEVMAYKQQMEENERYYKEIAKVIVNLFKNVSSSTCHKKTP